MTRWYNIQTWVIFVLTITCALALLGLLFGTIIAFALMIGM
jgi:hypothetical protein